MPKTDEIRPVQDLVQEALGKRAEIAAGRVSTSTARRFCSRAPETTCCPALQAFAEFTNNGLAGPANPLYQQLLWRPQRLFPRGHGHRLSQILRRNFPNYSAGLSLNIPFRNRQAQADYVTDELQLRQSELQLQRAINQVRVDVKTNLINLQQARARYETAVATRELSEQSLDAEQKRFKYGVGSVALVIAGAAATGFRPGRRSAGHGQLHPRQDRLRRRPWAGPSK